MTKTKVLSALKTQHNRIGIMDKYKIYKYEKNKYKISKYKIDKNKYLAILKRVVNVAI